MTVSLIKSARPPRCEQTQFFHPVNFPRVALCNGQTSRRALTSGAYHSHHSCILIIVQAQNKQELPCRSGAGHTDLAWAPCSDATLSRCPKRNSLRDAGGIRCFAYKRGNDRLDGSIVQFPSLGLRTTLTYPYCRLQIDSSRMHL